MIPVIEDLRVQRLDIYLTFQCNLRCKHCFVGSDLGKPIFFSVNSVKNIFNMARSWHTTDVAFLGGEPTVYPHLVDVCEYAFESGMKDVRIITNGTRPFLHFLNKYTFSKKPLISFSIDGASPEVHDRVRGNGAFNQMILSINHARKLGYRTCGITSIGNHNKSNLHSILDLAQRLTLEYLTIHYVSERGNATEDMVIPPEEWLKIMDEVVDFSSNIDLEIRFEQTFFPKSTASEALPKARRICAVRSLDNLMFYPDGRVFVCGLFLGQTGMHSFIWDGNNLTRNIGVTERTVCEEVIPEHCHGLKRLAPNLFDHKSETSYSSLCIYDKAVISRGTVLSEHKNT